jgi:predicted ATP-binding protein involved in virulence
MEATVAAPAEPQETHDGEADATRSTAELFQWSGYVHVGGGAEECEHGVDGECQDSKHFHAWVCLPNPFQIRDITDKARAAKARRSRALKDPESDAYAILEDQLSELRDDPELLSQVIDTLAAEAVDKQLVEIIEDMRGDERFEHHDQDAEEFRRLQELPEDERDVEEWERLQDDMLAYANALREAVDKRTDAEKQHLRNAGVDKVIDKERKRRIEADSGEYYLHTYYTWAMFVGARKPTTDGFPSERKFAKPEDLKQAPPEAITALREKIRVLEQRTATRGDAAGN